MSRYDLRLLLQKAAIIKVKKAHMLCRNKLSKRAIQIVHQQYNQPNNLYLSLTQDNSFLLLLELNLPSRISHNLSIIKTLSCFSPNK